MMLLKSKDLLIQIALTEDLKVNIPHAIKVFDYCLEHFIINHDRKIIDCNGVFNPKEGKMISDVSCNDCVAYKEIYGEDGNICVISSYQNYKYFEHEGQKCLYRIMKLVSILLNRYEEFLQTSKYI